MKPALFDAVRQPKIYGYTTPEYANRPWKGKRDGKGLIKVGYTDGSVKARIEHSLEGVKMPTAKDYELRLTESAISYAGVAFLDHSVHKQLVHAGVQRIKGTEWFECTKDEVLAAIEAVKLNTALTSLVAKRSFPMRPEQREAVDLTAAYFEKHAGEDQAPRFLWNAKMRFGKTFTSYQLAKAMGWTRVLVLTYKPAVEQAWRDDLEHHTDFAGWRFKGKRPEDTAIDPGTTEPLVWFASFQDVLGTDADGNPKEKNEALYRIDWDCVIVDEYHFGAWRDAARALYLKDEGDITEKKAVDTPDLDEDFTQALVETLRLKVQHFLFLSGTPFRALTEGEFLEDQVFNWTYSDEQRRKSSWSDLVEKNPYASLPQMNLLVYEMPAALREVALNNMAEFSLTEFFRTSNTESDADPRFVHEGEVQKWLDLLRGQDLGELWSSVTATSAPPLPYEDTNLLRALQHTVWYLPGVDSCRAMARMLEGQHNTFFHDYVIKVAAGPGAGIGPAALGPVEEAIGSPPQDHKTITLSCGKLMTGVTVPPWTGIFMLRELQSPESYFQAAFRVQSPWATRVVDSESGGEKDLVFKEQCFVFDFSPNRALRQIVDYATRLRGANVTELDVEDSVEEFMEFLPVLSFDGYAMARLDASAVVDFLTRGISSTMLARRWNSPELVTLDLKAMEALLANPELLESLEEIEQFREVSQDLTMLISSNKELSNAKLAKEPMSKEQKQQEKTAAKRRGELKSKLQRFLTRIPAFMYLTDFREKSVKDLITKVEPDLFQRVTELTVDDFSGLIKAGVFSDSKMNDAVWKFRSFEEPSLSYETLASETELLGGWNATRDRRLALLIERSELGPGTQLKGREPNGVIAEISDDFGILVDGIRYPNPREAMLAVADLPDKNQKEDGWAFWSAQNGGGASTLEELEILGQDSSGDA